MWAFGTYDSQTPKVSAALSDKGKYKSFQLPAIQEFYALLANICNSRWILNNDWQIKPTFVQLMMTYKC